MKEKFLAATFVAGQLADASITTLGVSIHHAENSLWMKSLQEQGGLSHMLVAKIAVSSLVLGLYAISREANSKYASPVEKGLIIGNLATWVVVSYNTLRLIGFI
ncbi:MAG: hypothetical protein WC797_04835 [Candidatus Paceibacterota bacterium]|jgi:hypothetical protein